MSHVTPEQYYEVAKKLCAASTSIESSLRALDNELDVSQSAGTYATGGPAWATSFDQSASDVFEIGSTTSMAARELGYQVHQAGLNWAHAENESGTHSGQPTPAPPQGSTLNTNLHPTKHAVGGTHEKPNHWDLIADYVKREWADCKEGSIGTAGTVFKNFGAERTKAADSLWVDVSHVFSTTAQDESPEVRGIVDEVANVCSALNSTGESADALATACAEVHRVADQDKDTGRTSLQFLHGVLISYEVYKISSYASPWGKQIRAAIDVIIELNKIVFALAIDALSEGISETVSTAANSNTGIYAMATSSALRLSSILDRIPRQTHPVRNRDESDNSAAGQEGERRAGIPQGTPKQKVTVTLDGHNVDVVPDLIDDDNRNVVEVKNTNEIRPYSEQVRAEAEYAKQRGYTMTLVVDHRTQINDPQIQQMIESGQIQLVRKELDDNDTH